MDQMAKPGERVGKNSILARIHAADAAAAQIREAFDIRPG